MKNFQSTKKEQILSLKTKQETLEITDTELTDTTVLLNKRLKQLRNEKISTDKPNQSSSQTKSTPGDHLNKRRQKIYIEPIKESENFKPNITENTTFKSAVYQESKKHDKHFQQNSKTIRKESNQTALKTDKKF